MIFLQDFDQSLQENQLTDFLARLVQYFLFLGRKASFYSARHARYSYARYNARSCKKNVFKTVFTGYINLVSYLARLTK